MQTSPSPPEEAFGFTVNMDDGFVVYDCGHIIPISEMWDEDGDWTRDRDEAVTVAWRPPGDYPFGFICVFDLNLLEREEEQEILTS